MISIVAVRRSSCENLVMVTDKGKINESDCFRVSRSYERTIVQFHICVYYRNLE